MRRDANPVPKPIHHEVSAGMGKAVGRLYGLIEWEVPESRQCRRNHVVQRPDPVVTEIHDTERIVGNIIYRPRAIVPAPDGVRTDRME